MAAGRDEVLAWMAVNRASLKQTGQHFGIPWSTVASWVRRTRQADAAGKPRTSPVQGAQLTVINTPPTPKAKLSRSMQAQARRLIRKAFRRINDVIGTADVRECMAAIQGLTDRFDLFAELKPKEAEGGTVPDLSSPDGEEALVAMAAKIPARVLDEARRRQMNG